LTSIAIALSRQTPPIDPEHDTVAFEPVGPLDGQMRPLLGKTLIAPVDTGPGPLGGTQYLRPNLGAPATGTIPGGFSDAFRTMFARDYPTWSFQMNFSYPLGSSPAEASYARARIQRNQTAAQIRALELSVATDVTNSAVQVESSLKSYEAASVARELAQTRLQAEQSRFEVGLSTNFFVVQAQRDLATAQNVELRALLDYRQALVEYERSQEAPPGRPTAVQAVTTSTLPQ